MTMKNDSRETLTETEKTYDVIVIGGGAAGMSAALWCDELGLRTLLLEQSEKLGGQLWRVYNAIKNHLGVETANGMEMSRIFEKQIAARRFDKVFNCTVSGVDPARKTVTVDIDEKDRKTYEARALIVATGVSRRKLNVAGEDEFVGKGILESGARDGHELTGKTVCIVGGGDAALENASMLAEFAAKVLLVHRRHDFRARAEFRDKVKDNPKIEILADTVVTKICGDQRLEKIELQNTKSNVVTERTIDALLIRIGVAPNSELFASFVECDAGGYIITNREGATTAAGIFAVGDVANPVAPTVSTAVGTGAAAAKAVAEAIYP